MNLKQLLLIILVATIVCWLIWFWILFNIDPTLSSLYGLLIFYLSLFLSLIGTFFLISFSWRKIFSRASLEYKLVGTSFRQSIFLAFLVIGVLFLKSQNYLTLLNMVFLIVFVTIIEFFFIKTKRVI